MGNDLTTWLDSGGTAQKRADHERTVREVMAYAAAERLRNGTHRVLTRERIIRTAGRTASKVELGRGGGGGVVGTTSGTYTEAICQGAERTYFRAENLRRLGAEGRALAAALTH